MTYDQQLLTPQLIDQVIETGTAFVPDILDAERLEELRQDVAKISWQPQTHDGDPWLRYEDAKIAATEPFDAINALRVDWESQVRTWAHLLPSLWNYRANDVTAQHYRTVDDGIDTHQDYSVDRILIAVFTVCGSGPFEIMSARHNGTVVQRYDTRPGSLNLLWAPDLVPSETDRRPPHRIVKPQPGRISLTYRYAIAKAHFQNETRDAQ